MDFPEHSRLIGRIWRSDVQGVSVIAVRNAQVFDITAHTPTTADFLDAENPVALFDQVQGQALGHVADFVSAPEKMHPGAEKSCVLAPCDVQAIKASGVTFARSMIERVIDERTAGDPKRADAIRQRIGALIGGSLANVRAGSAAAQQVREVLQREGLWSQYLEVGIGPDAEIFTKSQPLSAVGYGALIGINPISQWNNPEPEVVLAVNARGEIRGATLGNDVNLRDVEGRSALLLGKAKDNNASCAIGPLIRLLDENFSLDDVAQAHIRLSVRGSDGFLLEGQSNMQEISRSPQELVRQALSCHQYPDGLMLFLGTMFAPTQDRGAAGSGFTHHMGDVVRISSPLLGTLENTVTDCHSAPPWNYGVRALMRNLAQRGFL